MFFIGKYPAEMAEVTVALAVAKMHGIFLGAPGYGKTRILLDIMNRLAGADSLMIRVNPSTPMEAIEGTNDPEAFLNRGELVRVTLGTPYQAGLKIVTFDESFRGTDPLFDSMMFPLDRVDEPDAPICLMTANFVATGGRVEALLDRIAMWYWVEPPHISSGEIARARLSSNSPQLTVNHNIPDWQRIEEVRNFTPGPNAIDCVSDWLDQLEVEAIHAGRKPHPRRSDQWTEIAYYYNAHLTDNPDFDRLLPETKRMIGYCYPATTSEEAAAWRQVVASVADKVGAAIDEVLSDCMTEFRRFANITDEAVRNNELLDMAKLMQANQATLMSLGDDPRIAEAKKLLSVWYGAAAQGNPEEITERSFADG